MGGFLESSNLDRSVYFANFNTSKYGASLDLSKPKGREVAWKLIKWADILAESFTPGTMKKWGLDYNNVQKVKPDIIYLSTCIQGQDGPHAQYRGFGPLATPLGGIYHISGWRDRMPSPPYGAYSDFVAPRFAAASIIAALHYRRRTGKGVYLDQSQVETSIQFISPLIMDYLINERIMDRDGNRLPYASPHGVFACKGDDRWVAIAVFSDEQWKSFCHVIDHPELIENPKFATLIKRKQNEDDLEYLVNQWTMGHTAEQAESMLQGAGIPASVVESNKDAFEDPQLNHRNHFRMLEHASIGQQHFDGPAFRMSKVLDQQFTAPCLGEHNEYVYKELLGLSDDEIADLLIEGVITTEADLPTFRAGF